MLELGISITILITLLSSIYWLGRKFAQIDLRFEQIDKRFEQIDERFKQIDVRLKEVDERFELIDKRFEQIDERFKQIDVRFSQINERFKQIDARFEQIDERLNQFSEIFKEVNDRLDKVEKRLTSIDTKVMRLGKAFVNTQEFTLEILGYEIGIREEAIRVVRREIRRMYEIALMSNPVTRDDWLEVKRLVEKDDLTFEEALRLKDLARKILEEYWDKPEAWKLLLYACYMVGYTARKAKEKVKTKSS